MTSRVLCRNLEQTRQHEITSDTIACRNDCDNRNIDKKSKSLISEQLVMATYFRRRSAFGWPITISVTLMALNILLMVCWIVLLAERSGWTALTVGVVAFTLILVGISFWLVLTIKEIRLNHRQANFVDSVTHELKSPIAVLQLYLETLKLRTIDENQREEFHNVMEQELHRLDALISQLLEVGRLDAIGGKDAPEVIPILPFLQRCAEAVCLRHGCRIQEVFTWEVPDMAIRAQRIVMDLIFSNLLDNAVKYGGEPPEVTVQVQRLGTGRVKFLISNQGQGIPYDEHRKVFQIFYRRGSELERRRKGTGLGLYIVSTLVKRLHGKIAIRDRPDGKSGCVFEIELPGLVVPMPEGEAHQPSAQPEGHLA